LSETELPPWLKEQLARYEQIQQNLQAVLIQKQQVDMDLAETDKALDELRKAADSEQIYKYAGNLLIKVTKDAILKDLTEKKEIAGTRTLVLQKQESRFRDSLKEIQSKIDVTMKGKAKQAEEE
jgi:prefoldin beta subunit